MAVQAHPCQPSSFHAFHHPPGSFPLPVELLVALVPPTLAADVPPTLLADVPPTELDVPPLEVFDVLLVPPAPVDEVPPLAVPVDDEDEVPPWPEPPLALPFDDELDVPPALWLVLPPWLALEELLLPPWLAEVVLELEFELPPLLLEALLLPPTLELPEEQTPSLHSGVFPLQTTPHWPQFLESRWVLVHWTEPSIMHAMPLGVPAH